MRGPGGQHFSPLFCKIKAVKISECKDKTTRDAHPVAEVGEPPDVSEVDCESDDGEEEVNVGVPRHATAVAAIARAAAVPLGDGVVICMWNMKAKMCICSEKRLRDALKQIQVHDKTNSRQVKAS